MLHLSIIATDYNSCKDARGTVNRCGGFYLVCITGSENEDGHTDPHALLKRSHGGEPKGSREYWV